MTLNVSHHVKTIPKTLLAWFTNYFIVLKGFGIVNISYATSKKTQIKTKHINMEGSKDICAMEDCYCSEHL